MDVRGSQSLSLWEAKISHSFHKTQKKRKKSMYSFHVGSCVLLEERDCFNGRRKARWVPATHWIPCWSHQQYHWTASWTAHVPGCVLHSTQLISVPRSPFLATTFCLTLSSVLLPKCCVPQLLLSWLCLLLPPPQLFFSGLLPVLSSVAPAVAEVTPAQRVRRNQNML